MDSLNLKRKNSSDLVLAVTSPSNEKKIHDELQITMTKICLDI